MSPKETANSLIAEFETRSGGGVWTYLHRARLASELRERINDPNKINQGNCGLCGPAAFVRDIATDDPVLYAAVARDLFDVGRAHLTRGQGKNGGLFLEPDKDLRTCPLPFDKDGVDFFIPEADWLMLATVRQTCRHWFWEHHFYKPDPHEGGTWPKEVAAFFKDVGYTTVINSTDSKQDYHSWSSADAASRFAAAGYHVMIQIHTNLLVPYQTYEEKKADAANHWVELASPIRYTPGRVTFTLWTWHTLVNVPVAGTSPQAPVDKSGNLTADGFLQHYYGYIAAKY
jgi:hypothetical protein